MLKSKNMSISGITISLIIISLYAGTILKSNKIFFIALSTYFEAIPIVKCGIKSGILSYIASSILAIILIPNKIYALMYILIGIYPIGKLFFERFSTFFEFLLKYLWFNITCIIIYTFLTKYMLINDILIRNRETILIIVFQFIFFIYDYVFTRFIIFINYRILKGE